jgi:hypothetical protein
MIIVPLNLPFGATQCLEYDGASKAAVDEKDRVKLRAGAALRGSLRQFRLARTDSPWRDPWAIPQPYDVGQ